jgi:hypothetical protein
MAKTNPICPKMDCLKCLTMLFSSWFCSGLMFVKGKTPVHRSISSIFYGYRSDEYPAVQFNEGLKLLQIENS